MAEETKIPVAGSPNSASNQLPITEPPFETDKIEIVAYLKSYAYDLEPWFLDDFGKPGYPPG